MRKLMIGRLVRGVDDIKVTDFLPCDFCKQCKFPHGPHPTIDVINKGTRRLDLVVVDLAGPNRPQTLSQKLYDMVIVDTFSQRFFVILLALRCRKGADAVDNASRDRVATFPGSPKPSMPSINSIYTSSSREAYRKAVVTSI